MPAPIQQHYDQLEERILKDLAAMRAVVMSGDFNNRALLLENRNRIFATLETIRTWFDLTTQDELGEYDPLLGLQLNDEQYADHRATVEGNRRRILEWRIEELENGYFR